MKKLILPLLFVSTIAFSQKSKTIDICRKPGINISMRVNYNENGLGVDTSYLFIGRDSRYQALIDFIVLKSGQIEDIYDLLKKCRTALATEDGGTSLDYNGTSLSVDKFMGLKTIAIYNERKNEGGYSSIHKSLLNSIIIDIEKYCIKNKIQLNNSL